MNTKRILPGALTAALLASTVAFAQSDRAPPPQPAPDAGAASPGVEWDKKRLDRLERNVERLENTIAHIKPQNAPPNLIEPDPEVVALEARVEDALSRVGDLETALRRMNGELDQANIEVEKSHKAEAAARTDADALQARVAQLEAKLTAIQQAQAATGQGGQPGQLGAGAPPEAAAPAGDPATDFKAAMQLMRSGEYDGASKALQDYLAHYPSGHDVPEAHYQLAETLYMREAYGDAAPEYVASLKGWPKTRWAPDALEKLSETLDKIHNRKEACGAIDEFQRRYAKEAAPAVKARAAALRSRAKCSA
jgi:tol-pal system protein YbgF